MRQSLETNTSTSRAENPAWCLRCLTGLSAGPTLRVWGQTLTWQWFWLRDFLLCAQARSPTLNCAAWNKFWWFSLQPVSRAAHFCYRGRPATDPQLYLLLWYKLYVLEVQEALGVQASQEDPVRESERRKILDLFICNTNEPTERRPRDSEGTI